MNMPTRTRATTRSATATRPKATAPAKASKRAGYHHGDLRRALLEASLALVEESGIGALSLREVARKAGVSHNAPYHHFKDRGSLLAALAEEGFAELAREMAEA